MDNDYYRCHNHNFNAFILYMDKLQRHYQTNNDIEDETTNTIF